jgi:hypothetical protein
MPENDSSARIDLSKATPAGAPPAPVTANIRLTPPSAAQAPRISISPAPAAPHVSPVAPVTPKAATGSISIREGGEDDIYKRRTALLDTRNIPMAGAEPAHVASPRTVRVSGRPTIRIGGNQTGDTFTPGRAESSGGAKPAIRLKRPGGAVTVSAGSSSSSSSTYSPSPEDFVIKPPEDDEPGAAWAVVALLGLLASGALIYFQVISIALGHP